MTSILVVDDDRSLVSSIQSALVLEGFTVLVSHNVATTAVHAVDAVDLILSDWWLPDGNAADIQSLFPQALLLILTGDANVAERKREQGIQCLIKPVGLSVIIATVHQMFGTVPTP